MQPAVQQLATDLKAYGADIGLITETWLKKHHNNDLLGIDSYNLLRRDRIGRRGGGVAAYASTKLTSTIYKPSHEDDRFEILWIKITVHLRNYYIGITYHPPKTVMYVDKELIDYIGNNINTIAKLDLESVIVLTGDFNQLSNDLI